MLIIFVVFNIFSMAAWMIDEFGSEELKERFIPELASMEVLSCLRTVPTFITAHMLCTS